MNWEYTLPTPRLAVVEGLLQVHEEQIDDIKYARDGECNRKICAKKRSGILILIPSTNITITSQFTKKGLTEIG